MGWRCALVLLRGEAPAARRGAIAGSVGRCRRGPALPIGRAAARLPLVHFRPPVLRQRAHTLLLAALLCCGAPVTAEPGYSFQYTFHTGDQLTYETRSTSHSRVEAAAQGQAAQRFEARLEVRERTLLRVSVVREDGSAWLAWMLRQLSLQWGPAGTPAVEVSAGEAATTVRCGPRTWTVPGEEQAEVAPGLTAGSAAGLLAPVKLLVARTGRTLARDGRFWSEQLAALPAMAAYGPLLAPAGSGLPELPGRTLGLGDQWRQERTVALPFSRRTYPLELVYAVAAGDVVGPFRTVRVDVTCGAQPGPQRVECELRPGWTVPLELDKLQWELGGRLQLDPAAGRLVEQRLDWRTDAAGHADQPAGLTLSSRVEVSSVTTLLGTP